MGKVFKKLFKKENPINDGNFFELEQKINAKEVSIKSYMSSNLDNVGIGLWNYNYWELLNFHADYFTNLFKITFNDYDIDRTIYTIFRCNFLYGNVGLYKKDDKIIPVIEETATLDIDGKPLEVNGYGAYEVLAQAGDLKDVKKNLKTRINIKGEELQNYCRLNPDTYGFGAIVKWNKFVRSQEIMLKKINNYSHFFTRKIVYNVQDLTAANQELKNFFQNDYPFVVNANPINPTENQFVVNGFENVNSNDVFDYYNQWIKINYELLGRRINVDFKKERNISNEVDASQSIFDTLENEQKINKTNFLNNVKKLISMDWEEVNQPEEQNQNPNGQDREKDRSTDKPNGEVNNEVKQNN